MVQPPDLGNEPITLPLVNRRFYDRFNALTEAQFESVLDQTVRSPLLQPIGLEVRFELGDDYTMAEHFLLIP